MPGICGIVASPGDTDLRVDVSAMSERMVHHPWYRREDDVWETDGIGLARVSLGHVNREPQPVRIDRSMLVMDGEIYGCDTASTTNDSTANKNGGRHKLSQAEQLLRGYLAEGDKYFRRIHGKFTAAIWEADSGTLTLVNDRYGMKPVYYTEKDGRFLFASELKSLLAIRGVSGKRDLKGLVQFFTFGHLWGTQTLYDGVRVLPPGACLRFRRDDGSVSVSQYINLPAPEPDSDEGIVLEEIDDAFHRSVRECTREQQGLGIALSGGMDARTILALIDEPADALQALCMGMHGSRDQVSARQMAQIKGCGYSDLVLGQSFLLNYERHLNQMVRLTDGHYLSQCIVMPTFEKYRELGIRVLLRGHAGELMHMHKAYNFSLDPAAFSLRSNAELEAWLFGRLRAYMRNAMEEPLLVAADRRECDEIARETIRESLQLSDGWDRPVDRIWQVFITERLRRETAMSLVKFGSVVETRLPYLAPNVLDALAKAPAEMKMGERIQTYILKQRYPQFLKITNVNTGARVGAGRLLKSIQSFKTKVFAKLGVPGYQPYERLGLWLRRELAPLVKKILLSEPCLDRGVFRPSTVRRTVNEHLSGRKNHTYLLMAMMIYERGQSLAAEQVDHSALVSPTR